MFQLLIFVSKALLFFPFSLRHQGLMARLSSNHNGLLHIAALYARLFLSQSASPRQTDTTSGVYLAVVSEYGLQQYFYLRGVNYTMAGVGNPGRAYYLEVFGGTGADALVADVPASSHSPGSPVQTRTQNGGRNQLWTMLPVGAGVLLLVEGILFAQCGERSGVGRAGLLHAVGDQDPEWTLNFGSNQQWIPMTQTAGSSITYDFTVESLTHLRFTGAHHQPNAQGQVFLINAPGPDYTSTASAFTEVFPIDGNGNFSIDATKFLESESQTIPQNAVAVLEDGNGYVSAMDARQRQQSTTADSMA